MPPLMDAYRGYYGGTFAAVLSGLSVYVVFAELGLIPPRAGTNIAEIAIELDYKAVLNVLATGPSSGSISPVSAKTIWRCTTGH